VRHISAGAAAFATILAACSNSDTMSPGSGGSPITQAEAQVIAEEMQGEVEAMGAGATVTDVLSPSFPAPPGALHAFRGPLWFFANAGCPTLSENPPTDTDGDGVPDNLVITFDPTACTFTFGRASMELSGMVTVSDPTTAGQGLRIVFGGFQQKTTVDDKFFQRNLDGVWQLISDGSGFAATDSTTAAHSSSSRPTATLAKAWQVNFVAEVGSTFSRHARLPSGDFAIEGTTTRTFDTATKVFSVETVVPLHRDITCDAANKIVSGELDIAHTSPRGSASINIVFNGCGVDPTVTIVTGSPVS
jgi:hypothetical protein